MSEDIAARFRIGMIGPSRVGKTSLVTSLLAESSDLLARSGVTMKTVGVATEDKINENMKGLDGDIHAGKFSPGRLASTQEPFIFTLKLDPGVEGSEINIELLDFPGGWLDARTRPKEAAADWENSRRFITESTVLLIPVDAAVLMEAVEGGHRGAWPYLLTTVEVQQVAREWAIERYRRSAEPALVAFCPVKCESYFKDNGGRRDRSAALFKRFEEVYQGTIDAVRAEAPKAVILYSPVDTIGCVEIVEAASPADPQTGRLTFEATYRIRRPGRVSRLGVGDVMRAVCRQLMEGRHLLSSEHRDDLDQMAQQAWDYARRREGFFRDIWLWMSKEREKREERAGWRTTQAQEQARRVAALDTILSQLATQRYGPRVKEL